MEQKEHVLPGRAHITISFLWKQDSACRKELYPC